MKSPTLPFFIRKHSRVLPDSILGLENAAGNQAIVSH